MNLDIYHRILNGETATAILSPRALWRLTGSDAARYLNGQVTNDVTKLVEGKACYAAVCTAKGRMEGDVSIALHASEFYLDSDANLRESLGARLDKYLIADDAVFEDVSELWQLLHVFGATAPHSPESGFVIAYNRFGVPGYDIWMTASNQVIAGPTVDADILEILRLEQGIPRWGAELTANTLPPEAGPHMLNAISYTKGCYVGQETIARLKSVGHVNRTLAFLRSETETFPVTRAKLKQGDHEVGAITSSGFSPRLEKGIALGYVRREASAEGTTLQVDDLTMTVTSALASGMSP